MKCAIYGAGSLGTVMGAYIAEKGVQIDLVNRNRAHVEALREDGACISGCVEKRVKVNALLPEEMEGGYDCIFLMTKQLDNAATCEFLKGKLSDSGVIVTLQNGIPEPLIASIVGEERTIGCIVEWGAEMIAPGKCRLTSDEAALSFHMGKMPKVSEEIFNGVKSLLENMCPVYVEENLLGARFSKLLINATFSGLGTVMGGTFGDVVTSKEGKEVALRGMKECIDVCNANGITICKVQGKDIAKLFYYKNPIKKAIAKIILPIALKKHFAIVPSMLQDLRKGKKCEIQAINGVICDFGRKGGVPTPINDKIVEIVTAEQEGNLPISPENIKLFK